ncbi:MAG: hypothetical protein GY757_42115 [bacterium]|nr:hypothetical protein [bacterium]
MKQKDTEKKFKRKEVHGFTRMKRENKTRISDLLTPIHLSMAAGGKRSKSLANGITLGRRGQEV